MELIGYPIKIEMIDNNEEDMISFKVIEQPNEWVSTGDNLVIYNSHRDDEVNIESVAYPEYLPQYDTFYIRGHNHRRDNELVYCSIDNFKRILNSLKALAKNNNPKTLTKNNNPIY